MKGALIRIEGAWGHFKRPETNNNPLTHDFMTKTALIGLVGSVLGKSRQEMKPLFPQLSEDLLYGVQVLNEVRKESWAFTLRKAVNQMEKAPKHMEFLRNPQFVVALGLMGERSETLWSEFLERLRSEEALFTLHLSSGYTTAPQTFHFSKREILSRSTGSSARMALQFKSPQRLLCPAAVTNYRFTGQHNSGLDLTRSQLIKMMIFGTYETITLK